MKSRILITAAIAALVLMLAAGPVAATVDECLEVTKGCVDAAEPGGPIAYSGTVTNTCAFTLYGVTVRDYVDGAVTDSFLIGTLAAGASADFAGSYVPSVSPSTDTARAYGYYFDASGAKIWLNDYAAATCSYGTPPPPPPPGDGCTLTPGYWKTHSILGPAPYDDTWALLPDGEATLFYLSGNGYLQALQKAPRGNAYYILAHAFIAAQLNALNGADTTAVAAAMAQAEALFQTYTPEQIDALSSESALRATFISLANLLDDYNNGFSGPGHCDK